MIQENRTVELLVLLLLAYLPHLWFFVTDTRFRYDHTLLAF
jgi:hypothetical protein